jgi:hypothetical protein
VACYILHDMRDFSGDIQGQKVHVEGGGSCIYCGSAGGADGLHDEHIIPYALGGKTELLAASCSACEKITSYLDGYLANRTYKHARVHMGVQSRRGHPKVLPTLVAIEGDYRTFELEPSKHPYFLHMPVWRPAGIISGLQPSSDFGDAKTHLYWYVPSDIRTTIGLRDGELAKIQDTTPAPNISTFARGIAKIAYCHAVFMFGLGGFRPLMLPDIILGRSPNIPYLVSSDLGDPEPPGTPDVEHLVQRLNAPRSGPKLITILVRLFAHSGTPDNGMPVYEVIVGSEGRTKWVPRPMPSLPKLISL